jgi:hypothetical protein
MHFSHISYNGRAHPQEIIADRPHPRAAGEAKDDDQRHGDCGWPASG